MWFIHILPCKPASSVKCLTFSYKMFGMLGRLKATDAGRLRAEYSRLVDGLAQRGDLPSKLES